MANRVSASGDPRVAVVASPVGAPRVSVSLVPGSGASGTVTLKAKISGTGVFEPLYETDGTTALTVDLSAISAGEAKTVGGFPAHVVEVRAQSSESSDEFDLVVAAAP